MGSTIAIAALIAALTGCAAEPAPEPTDSGPVSESPSPSTDPDPDPVADILFTITANVRAVDGRTIGISMAAHAPLASTDPDAAAIRTQFLSVCGAGNGAQPITEAYLEDNGSTLLRIEIASNTPDLTFASPIRLLLGSPYFAQSAQGAGVSPSAGGQTCFYGFEWTKSGTASAVADFENSDGVPDLGQWQYGRYGFAVDPASGTTIEACRVTITELGMKNNLADAPGWDTSTAGDGISCSIGYVGE
jgi:hypothetical protein